MMLWVVVLVKHHAIIGLEEVPEDVTGFVENLHVWMFLQFFQCIYPAHVLEEKTYALVRAFVAKPLI